MRLCVMHNLYFYNTMMAEIRKSLDDGEFAAYKKRKLAGMMEEEEENSMRYDIAKNWRKG